MSQDPVSFDAVPIVQPASLRRTQPQLRDLHRLLRIELAQAGLDPPYSGSTAALLRLISSHYEQIDDERRGMVRSMQLIADEARSYGDGLAENSR